MKVTLTFVPPGGGEADHGIDVDLPAVPKPGDYLCAFLDGVDGRSDFVVLRVWWHVKAKGLKWQNPKFDGITVECEYALSARSSEQHKKAAKGNVGEIPMKELPESGF